MGFHTFHIKTHSRTEMLDITARIVDCINEDGVIEGICLVYCPHTTAGITINENADPSVQRDILMEINKIIPFDDNYSHMEGNSAAHLKSTITGAGSSVPVHEGRLVLGTWQGLYFCEYDGPRTRTVIVQIIKTE